MGKQDCGIWQGSERGQPWQRLSVTPVHLHLSNLFLKAANELVPIRAVNPRSLLYCGVWGPVSASTARQPVPATSACASSRAAARGPQGTAPALGSATPAWGWGSTQGWRHRELLASCSAQTPCFGMLNLAVSFGREICMVLCVPEVARRARSQVSYFGARPALLPPAGLCCSITGSGHSCPRAPPASAAPRCSVP